MWRIGSSTMMRRSGLLCFGKEARMFVLSDVVVTMLSCRLKMAGYASKESFLFCLLHTSANVDTCGGGQGSIGVLSPASVCALMGS